MTDIKTTSVHKIEVVRYDVSQKSNTESIFDLTWVDFD